MKHNLNTRELEVLRLMTQGLNTTLISERLYLTIPAVKYHIDVIMRKLGVENKAEAVIKATSLNLV